VCGIGQKVIAPSRRSSGTRLPNWPSRPGRWPVPHSFSRSRVPTALQTAAPHPTLAARLALSR